MYYNSYGYSGMIPNFNIPQTMPNPLNELTPINTNNFMNSQFNDLNERVNRLERQIKRIDQRLTRIETPYTTQNYTNEPDNNMYMV